jgi:succinate dehydrogenase/fumarate reductase flavoprotein subunit
MTLLDTIIVGAGPAGMTAAIYDLRKGTSCDSGKCLLSYLPILNSSSALAFLSFYSFRLPDQLTLKPL